MTVLDETRQKGIDDESALRCDRLANAVIQYAAE